MLPHHLKQERKKSGTLTTTRTGIIKYTKMYPTGAARIIETSTTLTLPKSEDGMHELTIRPLDPGVVIYKIVVDNGGYEKTYLKMKESPYQRQ